VVGITSATTTTEKDHTRIPKYNGKQEDYHRWRVMFLAVSKQKNMPELVANVHDSDLTPKDDDECEDENGVAIPLRLKIKEQYKQAFAILITSIATDTEEAKLAFDTVAANQQATRGYVDGNFKQAWLDLKEIMVPRNQATLLVNREEYENMKMRFDESPAIFMAKLHDVRLRIEDQGRDITETEFIMDVLSKLPDARSKYGDPPYGMSQALIEKDIYEATKVASYLTVQQVLINK